MRRIADGSLLADFDGGAATAASSSGSSRFTPTQLMTTTAFQVSSESSDLNLPQRVYSRVSWNMRVPLLLLTSSRVTSTPARSAMKFMFLVQDRQSQTTASLLSNELFATWSNAMLALDFVHVAIAVAREL